MSGTETLDRFITNNDPINLVIILKSLIEDYNKPRKFGFLTFLHRLWILKVRYPMFKYKLRKLEDNTIRCLYNNPETLVFIINRYILYFATYCKIFNLEFKNILKAITNPGEMDFEIDAEEFEEGIKLNGYNIIARSLLPTIISEDEKYTISTINVDINREQFEIGQIVYDTNNADTFSTAKVLYNKQFRLDSKGNLYNPNYYFDKSLLLEDLKYYKLMLAHLMSGVGGIMESTCRIYFSNENN